MGRPRKRFTGKPDVLELPRGEHIRLQGFAMDLALDVGLRSKPLPEVLASVLLTGISIGTGVQQEKQCKS